MWFSLTSDCSLQGTDVELLYDKQQTDVSHCTRPVSFVHEDIKLIIKEFRVSIPRLHSRGIVRWLGIAPRRIRPVVPALVPALPVY